MRLKLSIAYDGTEYHGWQVQADVATVQGEIERALSAIAGCTVSVLAAGRTDAGVHALGQVAHADIEKTLPNDVWRRALNAHLPRDIRIDRVDDVDRSFHARISATNKIYQYRAWVGEEVSPFVRRYVAHAPRSHDVEGMRTAARLLVGRHDFEAFTVADRDTLTTVRDLRRLDVDERGDEIVITAEANGFLRAMVRTLAGTLLMVGDGRMTPATVAHALTSRSREKAGPTAPAAGLTLLRVDY